MSEKEGAWQVLDRVTTARKNLLAAGYKPIPTNGKRPFQDCWQQIEATEADIESWARQYPGALNTGLLTARTPAVDIDVLDEAVAEEFQNLLWLMIRDNGRALVRYGKRPKRVVLFQTNEPFDKISTPIFISPNGDAHRVEVLCNGQQFVAHGTHPDTGMAYAWEGGEPGSVPRNDLPNLDAKTAQDFVAKATELMLARGWTIRKRKKDDARKSNGSATGSAADFDSIYGGREQKWAAAALTDLATELAGMAPETGRNERLYRAAFRLGTMVARGWIERATVEGRLLDACKANTLEHDTGAGSVRATLRSGLDGGEAVPHPDLDERRNASGTEASLDNPPLPFINMSNWDNEPIPEQEWAVLNRIPLRQAVLFSGEGAAGKSTVQLHLCAAHVLGRDHLGAMPEEGPAIYIDAEDDENVIHRRLAAVANHYQVTFSDMIKGGLHLISFVGQDAVLAAVGPNGKIGPTPLYKQLLEAAGDIKPKMIGIASSANVYAGNEIDRSQVQQFVSLLTRVAIVANGSLVLASHPSLTGITSDTGLSGNTQWHNAVRARFYMKSVKPETGEQADSDLREIVFKKNNYGPVSESIVLRYQNGLFLPVPGMTSLDKAAAEQAADTLFLELLDRISRQGRNVSHKKTAHNYAPTAFASDPDGKGKNKELATAMDRLFAANKIKVETYGRGAWQRIERK